MSYSIPAITGATTYIWSLPKVLTLPQASNTSQVTLTIGNTAQSGNITVKGQNDCGDGTLSTKAVYVKDCTGIAQNDLDCRGADLPQPFRAELTISISGKERQLDLTITDISGKLVYSEKLTGITSDLQESDQDVGLRHGHLIL